MKPITELQVQREATQDFLEGNSATIAIQRTIRVPDDAGGYTPMEETLPDQEFSLVGRSGAVAPETASDAGMLTTYEMQLIGRHDADVQDGDTFTLEGGRYRVTFVYPEQNYRVNVSAVYQGVAPE